MSAIDRSLEAITKARDNGIIMLSLPPHTSSKMQPLDIAVFKPFKTYYAQQIDKWMVNHVGMRVTEYDIAQLMKPAYLKATVPSNIISGFEAAGIFHTTLTKLLSVTASKQQQL